MLEYNTLSSETTIYTNGLFSQILHSSFHFDAHLHVLIGTNRPTQLPLLKMVSDYAISFLCLRPFEYLL